MSIIVNPHNQQEEQKLLAFLDKMNYDYTREQENFILSEEQQREVMERDKAFEAGDVQTYSLNEIIAHFNIKE